MATTETSWINPDLRFDLSGWVVDPQRLDEAVTIEVWVGERLVARTAARGMRRQVKKLFGGDGRHGFRIVPPFEFFNGKSYPVRILRTDTEEAILDQAVTFADLRLNLGGGQVALGAVTSVDGAGLEGWLLDPEQLEQVLEVELWVDGSRLITLPADIHARGLPLRGEDQRHGFAFRLPSRLYDDGSHAVEVRVAGGPALVAQAATVELPSKRKPRYSGELALGSGGMLVGSVEADGLGDLPIAIRLQEGERTLGWQVAGNGDAIELSLSELLGGGALAGELAAVVEPEGHALPISGLGGLVTILAVRLDGAGLAVTADLHPAVAPGGIDLLVLADSQRAGMLPLRGKGGHASRATGRLPLSQSAGRIALALAGGATLVSLRKAARDEAALALGADASWRSLEDPLVRQTTLARGGGGLVPEEVLSGLAGTVTYDSALGQISGWVVNLAAPLSPVKVELLADGAVRARVTADEPASVAVAGARTGIPAGFTFALEALGLPKRATLTVRVEDGPAFPGGTIPYAPGRRIDGTVDQLSWGEFRLTAVGRVHSLVRPGQPVPVELMLDGEVVDRVLARSEVEGRPGFGFELSAQVGQDGIAGRVAVRAGGVVLPLPALTAAADAEEAGGAAEPVAEPPATANEAVSGALDTLEPGRAIGWALVPERPDAPVDVMLYVGGVPFAHARTRFRRGDVERRHGGAGFAGFVFELPPNLGVVEQVELRVDPLTARGPLGKPSRTLPPRLEVVEPARALRSAPVPVDTARAMPRISIIILNQNGEALLDALFDSVLRHEPDPRFEWLVVDHVSHDGSEAACARARAAGLDVRWLPRDANHSFSESNNWGARQARGEVLAFVNNDVELAGRALGAMAELLSDPSIGMVGLKLFDALGEGMWAAAPPIQHLGVYVSPTLAERQFRPFEARLVPEVRDTANAIAEVPAVTGAFMAMRRADFEAVGGFDPRYFYGWEDIDLCLRVTQELGQRVVCLNERAAFHHRGFTRSDGRHKDPRRAANAKAFNKLWGRRLRRLIRQDLLARPGHWLGHRPVIAFAVTEASDETSAGDYFTALELGRALQRIMPVHIAYLGAGSWYDLSDVDVLIAMVDRFDPGKVEAARPHLTLVAWARNWFDRWCERPGIHAFDQVWASSEKAARWVADKLCREVDVVRIATNPAAFEGVAADPALASDYCFTGSRFGVARDIELDLRPELVGADGAVFGHNWEGSALASIDRGPLPYSRVPAAYASTRLVLDDANVATKAWGSCNSRVFDAIAAGRLVLTNGEEGARELFGDLLPAWRTRRDLERLIPEWLGDDAARDEQVARLREIVLAEHTYDARAAQVRALLGAPARRLRFAIKIAATEAAGAAWGDYHFAHSLADAIRAEGHLARVDLRERWYGGLADTDDVVIVLRGIVAYEPAPHQVNFAWVISHPDDLSGKELSGYDRVFVASELFAGQVAGQVDVPVETMLQCTDPSRFNADRVDAGVPAAELLFVGNSRGVERESVRWALDEGLPLTLYGGGWTTLVPASALAGRYVPNEILGSLYARARFVLCDHWHDMRRHGFVSNRVFDVLAAGGDIIVDPVPGLEALPDGVHVYHSREELARIVRDGSPRSAEDKRRTAAWVAEHHSFAARARVFVAAAVALEEAAVARPAGEMAQPDEPEPADEPAPEVSEA